LAQNKLYTFRGRPEHLKLLTYLNIRAVSLANNHIGDCGRPGMRTTIKHLQDYSIAYGGVGPQGPLKKRNHAHLKIKGNKVTILSYGQKTLKQDRATPEDIGAYYPKADIVKKETKYWRQRSDILIASIHWGTEYYDRPLGRQKKLARRLIDWGADAVIGHHSHWFQGIETYQDGVIIYSLGNFIFGSNSPYLRNGYMAGLIFANYQLKRVEIYPIHTKNTFRHRFQPVLLKGKPAGWVLRHTRKLTRELGSRIQLRDNYAVVAIPQTNNPYKRNHHLRWKLQKMANQ
jgi:poly-gamma-glutamate synthesis protein (capsule biosynthesis protein)